MVTTAEKSMRGILQLPLSEARAAWISRVKLEKQQIKTMVEHYEAHGFERVKADGPMTADGREVLMVEGVAMALRPEVHAERLAAAFEAAKVAQPESDTKSVIGTELMSQMTCPKCGDALQHTAVCPKCAAGKLGYRHRYTCVCGGVDMISKEAI